MISYQRTRHIQFKAKDHGNAMNAMFLIEVLDPKGDDTSPPPVWL